MCTRRKLWYIKFADQNNNFDKCEIMHVPRAIHEIGKTKQMQNHVDDSFFKIKYIHMSILPNSEKIDTWSGWRAGQGQNSQNLSHLTFYHLLSEH